MEEQQLLEGKSSCKTLPLVMEKDSTGLCCDLGKLKGMQNCGQSEPLEQRAGKLNPDSQCFYHQSCSPGRRAQPARGSWGGALSKCQHGAVQGQCLRLLPKTALGRGQEAREAARARISTSCVPWGLTGVFTFSHCVCITPKL